ncbi:twin-arginine translocase TatA/TatE family subunit [Roseibacterium sp. SDUM158017]|uniref:twin-arginine translocase TatA/TatE family subunit n=1 Tax=Roseicyclus salinarum TaxID=3036773 RepID=UPI0024156F5A|nr:twin-arginine translocase TatA/TatE family subunit [Roseibacterium sp. SDUM158017]MDG4649295.1 twin-arginine translocase TatA/TatE family subunit [Roseibacterium sp. SDUM158017]
MLNNIGPAGLLLIAVVVLVLFGRGKIASLMGEVGKGITAFKRGVKDSTDEIENASASTSAARSGDGAEARDVTPDAARERDKA